MHRFLDIKKQILRATNYSEFSTSWNKNRKMKPLVKWQILRDINISYCRVYQTLLQNWCKITTDFLYTSYNNTVRSIPASLSIYNHLYVHVAKYITYIHVFDEGRNN